MNPTPLRIHRSLILLGLAMAVLPFAQAAPAPQGPDLGRTGRPFPAMQLPAVARGQAVIQALGNRLPEVAAFYAVSEEEIRTVARRDRSLHVDRSGRLHYVCEGLAHAGEIPAEGGPLADAPPFPENQTFLLHSRPGASRKIYLDFDGHTTSGTSWNTSYNGGADFATPPFDINGNPGSFSAAELERIQFIWQRVAEDFASFDVDVTTEDPGVEALRRSPSTDTSYGVRVCIGGSSSDWYGNTSGGVAYIGCFNWSSDTPCFVFPANLANGSEKSVAEAASHEAGHTLGLYHDGTASGSSYYSGHGSGATSWAPIMGVGYSKTVVQWSRGEYTDANNTEDDLAKMQTYGIAYRPDDHGSSIATATQLPQGPTFAASGVIERNNDADVFAFTSGSGAVSITVNVATPSPNLDILAELYNASGTLVTSTNPTTLGLTLQANLGAGTYYLLLDGAGTGNPTTGYSDYASLGQYSLTGTVPVPSQAPAAPANFRITSVGNAAP